MVSEETVLDSLRTVFDPEIGINVVDLGLIYGIEDKNSKDSTTHSKDELSSAIRVIFTLTTPACPVGPMLQAQIHEAAAGVDGVDSVETEIVFSPPWDPREMASDDVKFELGIF